MLTGKWVQWKILEIWNTVEPPNKGHFGTSHFVLCRDVVLSLEVDNVLVLWESERLGPKEVSFIERLLLLCPLFRGSTIRGSTVIII